jgi:hypothetical protein
VRTDGFASAPPSGATAAAPPVGASTFNDSHKRVSSTSRLLLLHATSLKKITAHVMLDPVNPSS